MVTVNVVNSLPVGISTISASETKIKLSPNPASTLLHIQSPSHQATLTDLYGKILLTMLLKNGEAQMDVSNLADGIYFLRTDKGQGQKVVVVH